MGRIAKKKETDNENEDNEQIKEIPEEEITRDRKSDRFFEELPTDTEVKISIHQKSDTSRKFEKCGASFFIDSSHSFDIDEIYTMYGAGSYRVYAHIYGENGKLELYDSCDVTFKATQKPEEKKSETLAQTKEQVLNELRAMRELFGGGSDKSETNMLLLKIMEMNQQTSKELMKMQTESKKEMYDLFSEMNKSKTSDIDSMMKHFEFFQTMQGGGDNSSIMDKLIPALAPAIPQIFATLGAMAAPKPVASVPIAIPENIPLPSKPVDFEGLVDTMLSKIPDNVKNILTRENFDHILSVILEQYPALDRVVVGKALEKICEEKGV